MEEKEKMKKWGPGTYFRNESEYLRHLDVWQGASDTIERRETEKRLRELVEEGVLVETDPEEVILADDFLGLLESALKGLRAQEGAGEKLPEDLLYGASMLAYISLKGTVDEMELWPKVALITTFLELVQDNRLEEWAMKTRIRRL